MRILVTGANGQVGHELLLALVEKPSLSIFTPIASEGGRFSPPSAGRGSARGAGGMREKNHPPQSPFLRKGEDKPAAFLRKGEENHVIPATRDGRLEDSSNPDHVRGRLCERFDLADLDGLHAALDRIAPDLIVNAAAYTAVDRAEDEPELAHRINADAVGALGRWAARHGARVVHFSTDYVFDGAATLPYREDDATHPLGVYGRSKLAGETALRESGARHLIFRTAWVYAARGHNFLRTMLRLGAERDELRVVDDQLGAPTPARLIADVTALAIARWYGDDDSVSQGLEGTYHLVASGQTSWCGFAHAIFERARILAPFGTKGGAKRRASSAAPQARGDVATRDEGHPPRRASRAFAFAPPFLRKGEEKPARRTGETPIPHPLRYEGGRAQRGGMSAGIPRVTAIATADYPTRAKRPAYSVLDTTKLRATFGVEIPDWQTALDGVISELA